MATSKKQVMKRLLSLTLVAVLCIIAIIKNKMKA